MLDTYSGLYAIIPTPAKDDADHVLANNTVDLDETQRLINKLIAEGASGLIVLGTTGECATLSQSDYEIFVACVLEIVKRRIPTLIGSTAPGSHEVAKRMRFIRDLGADGTLLGLPIWQPMTRNEALEWYSSFSSAFPDMAIMVYANARAFRFDFHDLDFWEQLAKRAPTVTSAKMSRPKNLLELIQRTNNRINFMPNESTVHATFALSPETTTACWATAAAMDPRPALAIMRAISDRNQMEIDRYVRAISWANQPIDNIIKDPEIFAKFNIQIEKTRIAAAGYCKPGPCRPPYNELPAQFRDAAQECGRRWRTIADVGPEAAQ